MTKAELRSLLESQGHSGLSKKTKSQLISMLGTAPCEISLVEDIELFSKSSKGGGRDTNDAKNRVRERILEMISKNSVPHTYIADPKHGAAWVEIKEKFNACIQSIVESAKREDEEIVSFSLLRRGGRNSKFDFELTIVFKERIQKMRLEFKHGGKTIKQLPQYFNLSAKETKDKETQAKERLQVHLYGSYFYTNYLPKVLAMFEDLKDMTISEDDYVKNVHTDKLKHPLLSALYKKVYYEIEQKTEKGKLLKQISRDSIRNYLEAHGNSTNLELLTKLVKTSQQNKVFILFEGSEFRVDRFQIAELNMSSIVKIKKGNTLVVQSADPATQHHLLLRWKNKDCALYPAWQISARAAPPASGASAAPSRYRKRAARSTTISISS